MSSDIEVRIAQLEAVAKNLQDRLALLQEQKKTVKVKKASEKNCVCDVCNKTFTSIGLKRHRTASKCVAPVPKSDPESKVIEKLKEKKDGDDLYVSDEEQD